MLIILITIISDKSTQIQDGKGKGISFGEVKPAEGTVVPDLSLDITDTDSQTDRISKIEHEVYLLMSFILISCCV